MLIWLLSGMAILGDLLTQDIRSNTLVVVKLARNCQKEGSGLRGLDELKAERGRGMTIDIDRYVRNSQVRAYRHLMSQAIKISTLIERASQADVALLVVPADPGGFDFLISDS
eukprot:Gregarina_sp_Poly_1__2274@NODE_1603_length_3733_cov_653_493726_g1055_i0_p6_GENE_NODE_1603_length_3733_cov_653_493726_g1055_i0NODE_1603_length_3733_cov_653_493726_g1055_i0_p6_ORF_typecomplete_len113_score12_28GTP_EFTU/PF00009_27/0_0014_NODE_1603_length_3733_cov_653_493726_g1055_i022502588